MEFPFSWGGGLTPKGPIYISTKVFLLSFYRLAPSGAPDDLFPGPFATSASSGFLLDHLHPIVRLGVPYFLLLGTGRVAGRTFFFF